MEVNFDNENKYIRAKERVENLKKFYSEIIWYVIVVGGLAWINYYTNRWAYMWFLWVAFFWGIGVVSKGLKTYGLNPFITKKWEERKMREFMEEENDLPSTNRWE